MYSSRGASRADYLYCYGSAQDTRLRLGQISRFLSYPNAIDKLEESEAVRRVSVRKVLPKLFKLLGTLHYCLVSITNDAIPLISSTPKREGI
ncbi:MAG: hypothetical protein PUP91_28855 [Rhizonema sp. PD37]|nr:hypothetical protein [Rhizonema sp. PD37]